VKPTMVAAAASTSGGAAAAPTAGVDRRKRGCCALVQKQWRAKGTKGAWSTAATILKGPNGGERKREGVGDGCHTTVRGGSGR
jgi:hypothetical protein